MHNSGAARHEDRAGGVAVRGASGRLCRRERGSSGGEAAETRVGGGRPPATKE